MRKILIISLLCLVFGFGIKAQSPIYDNAIIYGYLVVSGDSIVGKTLIIDSIRFADGTMIHTAKTDSAKYADTSSYALNALYDSLLINSNDTIIFSGDSLLARLVNAVFKTVKAGNVNTDSISFSGDSLTIDTRAMIFKLDGVEYARIANYGYVGKKVNVDTTLANHIILGRNELDTTGIKIFKNPEGTPRNSWFEVFHYYDNGTSIRTSGTDSTASQLTINDFGIQMSVDDGGSNNFDEFTFKMGNGSVLNNKFILRADDNPTARGSQVQIDPDSIIFDSPYIIFKYDGINYASLDSLGNLTLNGRLFINPYQAFAYEDPDSVIVTSLSTSWTFLGGGDNNKFTNPIDDGFSFDGDTLMFNQDVNDTRDSVLFTINYGGQSATNSVNKTVYNGIFIKGALDSDYTEYRPCTKTTRTTTADVYYTGPNCGPTPIWLKDGDKIQIRARCAVTTTTLSTINFSVYLCERK